MLFRSWAQASGGGTGTNHVFYHCKSYSNGGDGWDSAGASGGPVLIACEASANSGIGARGTGSPPSIRQCYIHDNTANGFLSTSGAINADQCLVEANGATGLTCGATVTVVVIGSTIDGNTGATSDGIGQTGTTSLRTPSTRITNNILSNNGRYGASFTSSTPAAFDVDYNDYYGNATAARNNVPTGPNDQAVDPGFTDRAGGNFAIGTALKALGYPGLFPGGLSTGYLDIGAVQRQEAACGGRPELRGATL